MGLIAMRLRSKKSLRRSRWCSSVTPAISGALTRMLIVPQGDRLDERCSISSRQPSNVSIWAFQSPACADADLFAAVPFPASESAAPKTASANHGLPACSIAKTLHSLDSFGSWERQVLPPHLRSQRLRKSLTVAARPRPDWAAGYGGSGSSIVPVGLWR
jgi:hypothetical protein